MTRIVLHLGLTPPHNGEPLLVVHPWMWWETHAYQNHDGLLCEQHYNRDVADGPLRPRDQCSITFGRDWDSVTLVDPPALHCRAIYDDPPDLAFGNPMRRSPTRTMSRNQKLAVRVVWHEQPGPEWRPLVDVQVCLPGDYQFSSGEHDDWYPGPRRFRSAMPMLRWPVRRTIWRRQDGWSTSPPTISRITVVPEYRCLQCARYLPHATRDAFCSTCNDMRRQAGDRYAPSPTAISGRLGRHPPPSLKSRRPEKKVCDEIEALVNEQLAQESSGYDHNINQARCDLCGQSWHGLNGAGGIDGGGYPAGEYGCPGGFATDDEITKWHNRR